ncbi:inositol monophosphatase family protein [soil metagenome]
MPSGADLARRVAVALRGHLLPLLGGRDGRAHAGRAQGPDSTEPGDVTFAIDAEAERFLGEYLASEAPDIALYSEDRGLVVPAAGARDPSPHEVLVVDPIDGTRPALAGLESCCVSVAVAPLREGVTAGEVTAACVVEIPSGTVFCAERGRGLLEGPPPRLSRTEEVERMFWAYGLRGRPARATCEVLSELIDASSVGGATFELGSAAYDMTRVLTGQLDAYVEPGPRIAAEVPGMLAEFRRVGGGAVLNNAPYDLAAALLCLEEAGAVVTDASGDSLAARPLLGSDHSHQMSVVASSNRALHERILDSIDGGIERLRLDHQRRDASAPRV